MGRTKPVIILVCFLMLRTAYAWCAEYSLEPDQEFYDEVNNKLESLHIYFETGMYEEAAAILEELTAQFPDEPRFEYLQGIVDYQRGNYERAQKVFLTFVDEYPYVAESYYLLGEISLKIGNLQEAKAYFLKYSELVPEDDEVHQRIRLITSDLSETISIIKDGQKDTSLIDKLGFYGACLSTQEKQAIRLVNGSFCTWSSMGIDFAYPLDLRGKQITLVLKGKRGGEKLELTFRDTLAKDYNPQLVLSLGKEGVSQDWRTVKFSFDAQETRKIDLSQIVHMGLEIGSSTAQNPAHSTLYVKDIIIADVHN